VETSLGISQASCEGKYGREGILNSGRILTMVVCLGGATLARVALAQETQNAETQVTLALPLPQARLTTPLDPSTASEQSQQTTPPNANEPPAIDAPKPKSLGLTVDFASLPDAPRPQAIAPPENSDSQQSSTASVSGTVIDRNGAALEGAQVALTGPPGSPERTVQCGNNGQFVFTGLTPGIYKLAVIAPGMSTFTLPEIALHA